MRARLAAVAAVAAVVGLWAGPAAARPRAHLAPSSSAGFVPNRHPAPFHPYACLVTFPGGGYDGTCALAVVIFDTVPGAYLTVIG